jgi:hypothetical protein
VVHLISILERTRVHQATQPPTSDTLAEAAALTAYATDAHTAPTLPAIQSDLDDPYLTTAFLAVAEHVCDLRDRQVR